MKLLNRLCCVAASLLALFTATSAWSCADAPLPTGYYHHLRLTTLDEVFSGQYQLAQTPLYGALLVLPNPHPAGHWNVTRQPGRVGVVSMESTLEGQSVTELHFFPGAEEGDHTVKLTYFPGEPKLLPKSREVRVSVSRSYPISPPSPPPTPLRFTRVDAGKKISVSEGRPFFIDLDLPNEVIGQWRLAEGTVLRNGKVDNTATVTAETVEAKGLRSFKLYGRGDQMKLRFDYRLSDDTSTPGVNLSVEFDVVVHPTPKC